jgi:hypothetical protein
LNELLFISEGGIHVVVLYCAHGDVSIDPWGPKRKAPGTDLLRLVHTVKGGVHEVSWGEVFLLRSRRSRLERLRFKTLHSRGWVEELLT